LKKIKKATMLLLLAGSLSLAFANGAQEMTESNGKSSSAAEVGEKDDFSENVPLKFNLSYGNKSRTMTYNQSTPLKLSNGDVITAGMLKPFWSYIAKKNNSTFSDVSIQDATASDMIKTASTSNFSEANIFGGNSIATDLMAYGAEGKFVPLNTLMDKGLMPNINKYFNENPEAKKSITAFDGNIYHIPYIAEINNFARVFTIRSAWATNLLDSNSQNFDQKDFKTYYKGFYTGSNARQNTVTPKEGIAITKKTKQSIIEIQNALPVKNGKTLTKALTDYIKANYNYKKASDLYIGEKAAYDMDELIALWRCVKANPSFLTNGKADTVWPFFVQKSSYTPEIYRFATWFDGVPVFGTDSYESSWNIDKNDNVQYTFSTEAMYDHLSRMSDLFAEGMFYTDFFDSSNKTDFRTVLYGTDEAEKPAYGFMTFDWTSNVTATALNKDIIILLPPVAKINGAWQYFINNSRVIKPDGWAISVAGSTEAEIKRAASVMDYIFSDDGKILQCYGLLQDIDPSKKYIGPAGIEYPQVSDWVKDKANTLTSGDLARFLRDWEGAMMPIGYVKETGHEYQITSQHGFDGWTLLRNSTTNIPTYAGKGIAGDNPNYYKLVPSAFSLTPRQSETLNEKTSFNDVTRFMDNVVQYKTLGNASAATKVAMNYDEYLKYFTDRGLDIYVKTYQAAYESSK
jgi:hypothetical protein